MTSKLPWEVGGIRKLQVRDRQSNVHEISEFQLDWEQFIWQDFPSTKKLAGTVAFDPVEGYGAFPVEVEAIRVSCRIIWREVDAKDGKLNLLRSEVSEVVSEWVPLAHVPADGPVLFPKVLGPVQLM